MLLQNVPNGLLPSYRSKFHLGPEQLTAEDREIIKRALARAHD
jgi:hypothetical protein